MQNRQDKQLKYEIQFPGLPLTVYKEIAAHLRQVEGVETGLYPMLSEFDYNQSQVRALWIEYTQTTSLDRQRVDQILAYYQDNYCEFAEVNLQAE